MTHLVKDILNITYCVHTKTITENGTTIVTYRDTPYLPPQFLDVILEFEDGVEPTDSMIKLAVGKYILNTTGYTPASFRVEDPIPEGVQL